MRVEKLPFCHYHKERHKPTHCRQCGKFLPNCRLWYCGGVWGDCAREYFALENWQDARDLALKRTEGTCQKCGGPATEVHHLEPVRGAPRKGECNRKSNLMALCHKCHLETLPRTKNMVTIPSR